MANAGKRIPPHIRARQQLLNRIAAITAAGQRRLPPERVLCAEFGVSLNTVRKAIRQLILEERIACVPRKGYFVRPTAVVPNIGIIVGEGTASTFLRSPDVLCGILDVLNRRNCAVRLLRLRAPEAACDLFTQYKLDGCVWYLPDAPLFRRITKVMRKCAIPVVVPIMSYTPADLAGLPPNHFTHDFPAVGQVRTEYLLRRGHRRIAYCASTKAGPYAGFTAALARVGVTQDPDWTLPQVEDIPKRLPSLLDSGAVTAILCDGGRNRIESVFGVLDGHRWSRKGELLVDFIGGAFAEVTAAYPRVKVTAVNFYAHQEIGRGAAEALIDAVRDGRSIPSVRYASSVRPPTWSPFHKRGEMPLQDRTAE